MHVKTYFAIGKNPLYVIGYFFHILRMLQVSFHTQDKFFCQRFLYCIRATRQNMIVHVHGVQLLPYS